MTSTDFSAVALENFIVISFDVVVRPGYYFVIVSFHNILDAWDGVFFPMHLVAVANNLICVALMDQVMVSLNPIIVAFYNEVL